MSYMILRPSQEYLEPHEIVRRIEKVFAEVKVDADTGDRFLADRIGKLETAKEPLGIRRRS